MAIDPTSGPGDFVRPGHINPLRSREGGVLVRTGQTEGSVDLCRLAGLHPSAVIIEIMRDDGEMARMPDLEVLSTKHGIKICTVAQIIAHRLERESLVKRLEPAGGTQIRTQLGEFNLIGFQSVVDALPHVALCVGGVGDLDSAGRVLTSNEPTLVRMHRRNLLGDIFLDLDSSSGGPTGRTLHASMRAIQRAGRGAIVYLRPEGAGDAAMAGSAALEQRLQTPRRHTAASMESFVGGTPAQSAQTPAHMRDFGVGCQILRGLGLSRLRLMTNHPHDLPGLEGFGLEVAEWLPLANDVQPLT
jgi:3,4-dihydroxy 2-butanone 4-phosphate synthase/GTP cyclohydrolase II